MISGSRDLSREEVEERGKQFDSTLDADHSGVAERRFFNIANNTILIMISLLVIIIILILISPSSSYSSNTLSTILIIIL